MDAKKIKFVFSGAALLFAAGMAVYTAAMPDELLWDDGSFIGRNPFVRDCSNLGTALNPVNLFKVLPVPMGARPVVNASLIADACVGGGAPGMHLTNSLIHSFNGILLFLLILALSGAGPAALFGALVFTAHPAAVETVVIITFRSHLLGFFFFTGGLLAAIFHARKGSAVTAAACAACYLLAMMSVETAIVLPAAALAAVYFDKGREGCKKIIPLMAALAALALFYLWFRAPRSGYAVAGVSRPGVAGPSLLYPGFLFPPVERETVRAFTLLPWRLIYEDPLARLYTMARIATEYLTALVFPYGLNTDYSPTVITSAAAGLRPLAAGLAVAAASALLFMKKRLEGLGLVLLLTAMLPALNIWPAYNIKADRYLYLPLAGLALTAAAGYARLPRSGKAWRRWLTGAAWLWLGMLAFFTVARIPEFKDNLAFFSASVKKDPAIPRARINLASVYLQLDNCPAAVEQTKEAARLDPENYQLAQRLAFTFAYCGRRQEALRKLLPWLKKRPGDADALYLAGLLYLETDRREAMRLLRRAVETDPSHLEARLTLIQAGTRPPAQLTPADRYNLKKLGELYRRIGITF